MGNALLASIIAFLVVPTLAGLARGNPATQPVQTAMMSRPDLTVDRLLDAIRRWESRDGKTLVGDGRRSLGPYHIQAAYWDDAWEGAVCPPDYRSKVMNDAVSRATVLRYWRRYAPASLDTLRAGYSTAGQPDQRRIAAEVLARVHNGGPRGSHKLVTRCYWDHIQAMEVTHPRSRPYPQKGAPGQVRVTHVAWQPGGRWWLLLTTNTTVQVSLLGQILPATTWNGNEQGTQE